MKIFNKNKFPSGLFVAISFFSVIVVFSFFSFGGYWVNQNLSFRGDQKDPGSSDLNQDSGSDIIIRDDNYGDPLINRSPRLENRITEPIIAPDSLSWGNQDASVTIVEFSDFECKYCREQEKEIRDLVRNEYQGQVRLVWKDYPTPDSESTSWKASKAARCAAEQDKFWEYHDLLYQEERNLSKDVFLKLARDLGLNRSIFSQCLSRGDNVVERIKGNITEANVLGITGIPFLYIGDRKFMGKLSREELKKIIELEINGQQPQ